MNAQISMATIDAAVEAIRAGKPVIVADDEDRENEGDVVLSAALATQQSISWTVKHSSGLLCAPMTNAIADRLDLPMMVQHNEDARQTAYTVTVDAAVGITTGISAHDRMTTVRALADPDARPTDLRRPGHVLPLRAVDGGVRERQGHTEASVELMRLAGLAPVAVIAEIVAEDGEMMRLPELLELGAAEGIPVITIEDLVAYVGADTAMGGATSGEDMNQTVPAAHRERISLRADTLVPTRYGELRLRAYRDRRLGSDHVAVIAPDSLGRMPSEGALVRVHSECLTGEVFGSRKCECGAQLDSALEQISQQGGIVVYMRGHEGRGIGLVNKLRAYGLQEQGVDTLQANLDLGLPADAREYAAAAEILEHIGAHRIRLLTNNPDKLQQLVEHGVTVAERVPLIVSVGSENTGYLETKRDRMGHLLPEHLPQSHSVNDSVDPTGGAL